MFFLWSEPNAFEPEENIQAHYNLIRNDEIQYYPYGDYMQQQTSITAKTRSDIIYWMFELEPVLKVKSTTVHVAANTIDRYLWKRQMVPTGIKLLAIGALRTACEEVEGRALSAELII